MSNDEEAAMKHDDKPHDLTEAGPAQPGRRGFLKAAPLGALAVVAAGAGAAETPAAPLAPEPAPAPRGYHETEHIRRYYQTAAYW
jgi:hypothetical protein